jgi:4-alpha-glucanotransferase
MVVWGRDALRLPIEGEWTLVLEDGTTRGGRGQTIDDIPHGYHTLHLGNHEVFIIAAPLQAYAPPRKTWGVFAPLYSAHTKRSWGTGDLGDLLAYLEWVNQLGGGVVATLPMLAALPDEPSPYSPLSRLFWNELYLDLTRVPEFRPGDVDDGAIAHLRQSKDVDYAGVSRLRREVGERLAARYDGELPERLRDYAGFRAKLEGKESVRYHMYVQHRMSQQMREVADAASKNGLGLYLDFPLGVNPGGYDAQRYKHVFAEGVSVGAPPDSFFTKGQNWGFPPFHPERIREDRYEYFRACIRNHVEHAGILRIDHVMGLHRLYWIPNGADASDGAYVRYRDEELYAILVLESVRNECAIVGEDLGTVPEYVPEMMAKHGLRRMYVVQYEGKIGEPPAQSVASINTHDMPTFFAFWNGLDVDDRLAQGLLDEKGAKQERENRERIRRELIAALETPYDARKVLEALLARLAKSEAEIVLANIEDLWGETQPQNMPGVPERSWRHRFRMSLEQTRVDGDVRRALTNTNR